MTVALQIADSTEAVKKLVGGCNATGGRLLAEALPFKEGANAEAILAADIDRVVSLAMDLVGLRSQLAEANKELSALKRRA
jgi:hypothetical protein